MAQPLHQFLTPQENAKAITFRQHCTRSLHSLRTLSFKDMQSSEQQNKTQAKPRFFSDDRGGGDSEDEFEFSSTESNPSDGMVLFCGRIICQRPAQEEESTKMSRLSSRSVSNCSTAPARQSHKTTIGSFSFKAETGTSLCDMKKRQKQRERVPLVPTIRAAGSDELESAIASGNDGHGDHREKAVSARQMMKPKGNLVCKLAKTLLPL